MEKILHDKLAQSEEASSRLLDAVSRIKELEKNREGLQNTVNVKETQFSHVNEELEIIKRELNKTREDAESELFNTRKRLQENIADLERERDSLRKEFYKLEIELKCSVEENAGLKVFFLSNFRFQFQGNLQH
jgi:chromosome segregation ATPase